MIPLGGARYRKEDLDLGEEDEAEKAKAKELEEEYKGLTDWMAETLTAGKVEKARGGASI